MMEEKEKTPSISRKESQLSDCSRCASSLRKVEVGLLIFCIVLLVAVSVLFYKVMKLEKDFSACQARTNFQPSRFPPPSAEPRTEPQRMDSPLKPTVVSSRPTKPPTSSGRDGHSGSNNDQDGLPKVTHSKIPGLEATIATEYFSKSSKDCVCQGAPGPPGPKGPPGLPGRRGERGKRGKPGDRGYDGVGGKQGSRGPKGPTGPPGPHGLRGPPGKKGPMGHHGRQGIKGEPGSPGAPGEKGEKGDGTVTIKPRPFAHITGVMSRTKSAEPKGIIRDKWRDYGLFALRQNGFKFSNGELIIPEDGLYYVYSQFYFHHTDERKDPNMVHFMYRKSGSSGETILTSIVTRGRKIENKAILFNSYTGGLHKCKKGDRLMVGVSDELKGMVMYVETHTYFGAYLVERYVI